MKSVLLLASVLTMARLADSALCTFSSCAEVTCKPVTADNCDGKIVKNGSVCLECCDVCYRIIEPGETCADPEWFSTYDDFVYAECTEGYYCDYLGSQTCIQ
ncbi:unnamed protein product [Candidula unifasciata]|uniref:Uncharacterized protein n=1 Tax=Candidula unifasciata TaxID=100452 RepID=A0A8S3YUZ0_9EUPU|nr:unnamed protein product [Candidula unifasciata]